MKIFICEDDKDISELMQILISDLGYGVEVFSEPETMLEMLKRQKPGLLLLDYWLQDRSAKETIHSIKSNPKLKDLPIILISAVDNLDSLAESLPVNGMIRKPFNIDDFQNQITSFVNAHAKKDSSH